MDQKIIDMLNFEINNLNTKKNEIVGNNNTLLANKNKLDINLKKVNAERANLNHQIYKLRSKIDGNYAKVNEITEQIDLKQRLVNAEQAKALPLEHPVTPARTRTTVPISISPSKLYFVSIHINIINIILKFR